MKNLCFVVGILAFLSSCNINSNLMLKTNTDFEFDSIPSQAPSDYRISENDIIQFRLFTNDGFKLVDINSGDQSTGSTNLNRNNTINYLVETDGMVKLPTIKRFKISGLTVKEAENQLEDLYQKYYIDPFVILTVTNRRVLVFPGDAGDAKVVSLANNNTTLLEVIAMAGGISDDGRAKKVKLIREIDGERKIYLLDLSKIEGLKEGDLVVQANDIIYVETAPKVIREASKELAPLVAIVSGALVIITALNTFK